MSDSAASISERARQLADKILAGEQFGAGPDDALGFASKYKKEILVGGGLLLVVAILGGTAYYMKKSKSK